MTAIHKGRVVCHRQVQHQVVEVVDDGAIRTLHFGSRLPQTRMDLDDPGRLVSDYSRMMMAALPYPDQLRRILLVGLGGGCIVRFLMDHFPDCRLEVVEPVPLVVEVARDYFFPAPWQLPTIHLQDGLRFIHSAPMDRCSGYDLILVDAFDAMGMSRTVHSASFFGGCLRRLSHNGAVVVNLVKSVRNHYHVATEELQTAFDRRVVTLPVKNTGNVLMLAGQPALQERNPDQVRARTRHLQEQLQLPLGDYINDMVWPGEWGRFFPWRLPWSSSV